MAVAASPRGYIDRPRPSGLADVIEVILDKGLVIDAFVRLIASDFPAPIGRPGDPRDESQAARTRAGTG